MTDSCAGDIRFIANETEITQSFEPIEPAPPPPGGPPPGPLADVWPWLGLLGVLVVGGLLVWLFVLRGHGRTAAHAVPNVVGLRERPAIHRLNAAGYSVESVHQPLRRPRGVVGAQTAAGSTVTIRVSNGRALRAPVATTATTTAAATTTVAPPTAIVPDVAGQTAAAGAGQVEAAGFVAETQPLQAGAPVGAVVQESPPGGSRLEAGRTVTLAVATGRTPPSVQIPDVVGRTAAAARAALLEAKLTVRTTYRRGKTGVVLGESPTGAAPAWTQVTLSVGR